MSRYYPEYRSAIVDECGDVVAFTSEISQDEIDQILDDHEEYRLTTVCTQEVY